MNPLEKFFCFDFKLELKSGCGSKIDAMSILDFSGVAAKLMPQKISACLIIEADAISFGYSVIDQIIQDNLFGSAADAVHPSDPFHLILGFQSFGYALGFLHLLDQPVEHCTCNCAHFLQVGIQRSLKQHAGIEPRFVIPEVSSPSLFQNADLCRLLPQKLFA